MRLSMRVWDLPTRLFHLFAILLPVALLITAHAHRPVLRHAAAEALLILVLWRAVWGFAGSDTARWPLFATAPVPVKRGADNTFGHAGMGGILVPLMLLLLAALSIAALAHAPIVARECLWALAGLALLHLAGLAFYASRTGESLLRPLISGKKRMDAALRPPRLASPLFALLVLFCAAAAVILVLNFLHR